MNTDDINRPEVCDDAMLIASLALETVETGGDGWGGALVSAAELIAKNPDRAAAALIYLGCSIVTLLELHYQTTGIDSHDVLQVLALAGQR